MSPRSERSRLEVAIVLLVFGALDAMRIASALPRELFGDEWRYLYYADNLLHGFYSPRERVFLWNGPGYPLLLLPFVQASCVHAARYANALWHAGMLAYVWALLQPYVGIRWRVLALLALYFYQPLTSHLPLLYTEVVCCFLLTGWAYHAQRGRWHLLIAGVYLGVLCLTKVIFGVALLAWGAILAGLWVYRRAGAIKAQLQIALLAGLLCVPYLTYTYQLTGRWLYWSSAAGNNFYWLTSPFPEESGDWYHQGWVRNNPILRAHHKPIFDLTSGLLQNPNLEDQEQLFNLSTPEAADVFVRAGLENIRKHPLKLARNYLANLSRLFFDVPTSVRGTPAWNPASVWHGLLLVWTAGVALLAWRRRSGLPRVFWPSLGFALIALVAYTASSLSARFLIPFVPLWWPISCAWLGLAAARAPVDARAGTV
jgi:hypothetical protein